MFTIRLTFFCHSCQSTRKQHLGEPGFEAPDPKIEIFSDALTHAREHPSHWIEATIEIEPAP